VTLVAVAADVTGLLVELGQARARLAAARLPPSPTQSQPNVTRTEASDQLGR
jgi:hypothetical protein